MQLTKETAKWLKSLKVSENEVACGKNILKTEILDAADNAICLLESLQQQALLKGQVSSPTSIANAVDKISASDVKAVCTSIVSDCIFYILQLYNKCFSGCRQNCQRKIVLSCYW